MNYSKILDELDSASLFDLYPMLFAEGEVWLLRWRGTLFDPDRLRRQRRSHAIREGLISQGVQSAKIEDTGVGQFLAPFAAFREKSASGSVGAQPSARRREGREEKQ